MPWTLLSRRFGVAAIATTGWVAGCTGNGTTTPPPERNQEISGGPVRVIDSRTNSAPVNAPPAAGSTAPPVSPVASAAAGSNQSPPVQSKSALPSIPAGARYTLFCQQVGGASHVQQAEALRDRLLASTNLKDWYVIHEDQQSSLYYGFYTEIDPAVTERAAAEEARRAQEAKDRISAMQANDGSRPFRSSIFVTLDAPDPTAPPEWNIVNSPGFWSVQIAAYAGGPQRKAAAVEAVREARRMGVEAYYHHGPAISSVLIGSWPATAVTATGQEARSQNNDPDQTLFASNVPLPGSLQQMRDPASGEQMQVIQPKIKVHDATLLATLEQFPVHATNGVQDVVRARGQAERPQPSIIVKIPRDNVIRQTAERETAPSLLNPSGIRRGGTLRGLDQ